MGEDETIALSVVHIIFWSSTHREAGKCVLGNYFAKVIGIQLIHFVMEIGRRRAFVN